MRIPEPTFDHLLRLSDGAGLFEHAELTRPRTEHGYCVDDVARGLLVTAREPAPSAAVAGLSATYLSFVLDAQELDGAVHNRRRHARRGGDPSWEDEASFEDCWGRALWGLGTAAARSPVLADRALAGFEAGAWSRSPYPRAMAFAALGAAEVLTRWPAHLQAGALLADAAAMIGRPGPDAAWPWPEPRLRYANAALPETLIAAGTLLGDDGALADGLALLDWLLGQETVGGHLSVTPAGGWAAGEARPGFDQQPIEVAALADACARAYEVTGDPLWSTGVMRAADWFLGDNDAHTPLTDPASGGGCDGLEPGGRNENQGAESTLAMISTFQLARRLLVLQR